MRKYVPAGTTSEFSDGAKKKVTLEGQEILLARVGGNYYAVSNQCTHMNGDLSAGKLEGNIITCPRHASQFDIRNGQVIRWMKGSGISYAIAKALKGPKPLPTYPVKVEGDIISVEV
jgi:nitrite reductase/ring-hydroxylating ferredoxin subunit